MLANGVSPGNEICSQDVNSQCLNSQDVNMVDEGIQYATHPRFPFFRNIAERRAHVERMVMLGYTPVQIAEALRVSQDVVASDVEFVEAFLAARVDTERMRQHFTRQMVELAAIAESRYREDGSTVEGRLVIDAVARAAKLQGLDETSTEREVGGAWAEFLNSARDKVD